MNTNNIAANQANDNINELLRAAGADNAAVEPKFDWADYAKHAVVEVLYMIGAGYLADIIISTIAAAAATFTGSVTFGLIVWYVGIVAAAITIFFTAKAVGEYVVDHMPGDTRAAYADAKRIATKKFSTVKGWFAK